MNPTIARLKVIATALPTWLAAFALAAPVVAQQATELLPDEWGRKVATVVLTAAGVATFAVQTIRRLTPVAPAERGVLPVS